MQIKIQYGADGVTKSFNSPPTVADIKRNEDLRAVLGYGDNVRALISGVAQPDNVSVPDGVTVVIETAANTKA